MVKCGLHRGTLKGELYQLLSAQGNNGSKVSDLAKSSQVSYFIGFEGNEITR